MDKLADLAIIPILFVAQTTISYACSRLISKFFGLNRRKTNFVIAMGVFGNSNSLPISLVISLSQTIKGLHWDRVPGDNDNEVAARGILYLMIFQQLGQLLRWSWGYRVLLAPATEYENEDSGRQAIMENNDIYHDDPNVTEADRQAYESQSEDEETDENTRLLTKKYQNGGTRYSISATNSGAHTPGSEAGSSTAVSDIDKLDPMTGLYVPRTKRRTASSNGYMTSFPSMPMQEGEEDIEWYRKPRLWFQHVALWLESAWFRTGRAIKLTSGKLFGRLPRGPQKVLRKTGSLTKRFFVGVWEYMNPPLWAMLVALIVATIPRLQSLFFTPGSFVHGSVTRAVSQGAGVAVPLILVVLGANLARNTLPQDSHGNIEDDKDGRKMLIACLLSRMVLPFTVMAPFLAIIAKYLNVSILDDPIFVIVCFLITGAPSALQLAQICQINGVYEGVMSRLLFQSYVIWILPSTIVLVMSALEVVEWAQA